MIALGVLVIALIGAFYVWLYVLRDTTTQTDVSDAVAEFRQDTSGAGSQRFEPGIAEHVPPVGVYRYETSGGRTLDLGLIERSNEYDGISTITLAPTRCGVRERWQVLVERWSDSEVCLSPAGARLRQLTQYHELLGQSSRTHYTCREDPTPFTKRLRVGMSWNTTCSSDEGEVTTRTQVAEIEPVEVDGSTFTALRLESESDLVGDPDGTAEQISWMRRSDGLLLRRTASSDVRVDTAGGGDFAEDYEIVLVSPRPSR